MSNPVTISTAMNTARLDGALTFLDTGSGNSTLLVYDGTRPVGGGGATNLLVSIPMDKPSGVVAGGVLTLSSSTLALIAMSGTATWARMVNANGDYAFDCDVTDNTGLGPIKIQSTALFAGGTTQMTSGVLG